MVTNTAKMFYVNNYVILCKVTQVIEKCLINHAMKKTWADEIVYGHLYIILSTYAFDKLVRLSDLVLNSNIHL